MQIANIRKQIPALLKLVGPIALGQIGHMLFGFTDSVMIGRVGTVELAASAFANSVFIFFLIFGLGISNSTSPLISRALGAGDHSAARNLLRQAVFVNCMIGAVLMILALGTTPFFDRMGQDEDVVTQARGYYIVVSFSLLPVLLFQVKKQFLESIGKPGVPTAITLFALVLNIALNFVLIHGLGPIPKLGLIGAAWATLISRVLMCVPIVHVAAHETRNLKTGQAPTRFRPDGFMVRQLLGLGIPNGVCLLFEVGAFASAAVMMGWIGSVELAAHQVVIALTSLAFMVPLGISFAAGIRVSYEAGRGDYHAARDAGVASLIVAGLFMAVMALTFWLGRDAFPGIFSTDRLVLKWSARLLVVAAFFQLFDGIQSVGVGLLRGLHDVRWPMMISFAAYWILALPGGYALAFYTNLGPLGIWMGLFAGLLFAALFMTARFLFVVRRAIRSREPHPQTRFETSLEDAASEEGHTS